MGLMEDTAKMDMGVTGPALAPGEMRFLKTDLAEAIKAALLVVERRNTIPVLGTIRLRSRKEGGATVEATDLDNELTYHVACEGAGDVLLNPSMLAHVLRHGGPVISIAAGSEKAGPGRHTAALTIRSGDLTLTVHDIYPPEGMPVGRPVKPASGGTADAAEFLRALRAASVSISTEETRYYLNGVMVEAHEGAMRMVSTDGHRLTLIDIPGIKWDCPKQVIIPRKTISLMRNLFKPGRNISIQMNDSGMAGVVRQDGIALQFKAIDGTYPDYNRVIPTIPDPATFDMTLSGDALAMIYAPPHGSHALALEPHNGTMTLRCPDSASCSVPLTGRGPEGGRIGFNLRYLREFCPPGEAVRLCAENSGAAARIVGADPNALMILMPMRV